MGLHPLTAVSPAHCLEGKRRSRVIVQCNPGMSASTKAQSDSSRSQTIFIRGQGKKIHLARLLRMVQTSDKLKAKVVTELGRLHEMQILYALIVMAISGPLYILLQCFSKESPGVFLKCTFSVSRLGTWGSAFLTSSQVRPMLLVWGPHHTFLRARHYSVSHLNAFANAVPFASNPCSLCESGKFLFIL